MHFNGAGGPYVTTDTLSSVACEMTGMCARCYLSSRASMTRCGPPGPASIAINSPSSASAASGTRSSDDLKSQPIVTTKYPSGWRKPSHVPGGTMKG